MNIIVEVMHDDEFERKWKLLIIREQLIVVHLTVLFCLMVSLRPEVMRSSHTDTQWNYIIETFNMPGSNINISLGTQW